MNADMSLKWEMVMEMEKVYHCPALVLIVREETLDLLMWLICQNVLKEDV